MENITDDSEIDCAQLVEREEMRLRYGQEFSERDQPATKSGGLKGMTIRQWVVKQIQSPIKR